MWGMSQEIVNRLPKTERVSRPYRRTIGDYLLMLGILFVGAVIIVLVSISYNGVGATGVSEQSVVVTIKEKTLIPDDHVRSKNRNMRYGIIAKDEDGQLIVFINKQNQWSDMDPALLQYKIREGERYKIVYRERDNGRPLILNAIPLEEN